MPILPVIGGENSRLEDLSQGAFQIQRSPGGGYIPPKYLRSINNLMVASDGALTTRPGVVLVEELEDAFSFYFFNDYLYLHVGATIVRKDLETEINATVVEDVSTEQPVAWCEHQGSLRWTDGAKSGRFTSGGAYIPELPQAPTPDVTTISGALPEGRYLVSVTWIDVEGVQSGCAESYVADLNGSKDLMVDCGEVPEGCTAVRLWCSRANEPPVFVADYEPDLWPIIISTPPASATLLQTVALEPLPPGSGLATRGGFLVTWKDALVSFSAGDHSHYYDPELHIIQIPKPILSVVGVEEGLWVSTDSGLYWVEGKDLTKARLSPRKDSRKYAAGGALLPPELTKMQTSHPVAVFASTEGAVFGTSDGQISAPIRESQKWDVAGKTASFAVWEWGGEKFIMVGGI